ncbi:hypothetical protein EVAR_43263_1 [Eumeta japonica]|uniref:Uncharacterized protein n=1 Tax=Eumeta variegata TaxID=151549 RepID=A0A4C1WS76_EUMVA|nr:hypothetical protein EVAR_43263_1 [Eumeta japonica]
MSEPRAEPAGESALMDAGAGAHYWNTCLQLSLVQQLASRWHWLYRRYCACVIPLFAPQSGDSCLLRVSALGHLKKNTA